MYLKRFDNKVVNSKHQVTCIQVLRWETRQVGRKNQDQRLLLGRRWSSWFGTNSNRPASFEVRRNHSACRLISFPCLLVAKVNKCVIIFNLKYLIFCFVNSIELKTLYRLLCLLWSYLFLWWLSWQNIGKSL